MFALEGLANRLPSQVINQPSADHGYLIDPFGLILGAQDWCLLDVQ